MTDSAFRKVANTFHANEIHLRAVVEFLSSSCVALKSATSLSFSPSSTSLSLQAYQPIQTYTPMSANENPEAESAASQSLNPTVPTENQTVSDAEAVA
jgi:hypothetical protein